MVDAYDDIRPNAQRAFDLLSVERDQLSRTDGRSADQDAELEGLEAAELWASGILSELPESLEEPRCPALRD
jgi:hypothetical protein